MSNNTVLALFSGEVTGELLVAEADGERDLLRIENVHAERFLALAGIGCATPPACVLIELGAGDVAYLQDGAIRPPDEMIRIAHLVWDDNHGHAPDTISTFLVR